MSCDDNLFVNIAVAIYVTALCAPTETKKFFESVALQQFQKISCSFNQKLRACGCNHIIGERPRNHACLAQHRNV